MRGEEVSREIPFIFSRALASTWPWSAWSERKRVLSAPGKGEAPGWPDAGSKLEEAELPHGVDGGEMGWMGHSDHPWDR